MKDAILTAEGRLDGRPVICCSMEFGFIGGSMGAVVGEKVARAIERSIDRKYPLIVVSCSGGARMMEGAVSLMQLAKVSAALARLDEARVPFISVLTDPTTGGVTASYAMLGRFEHRRARRADRFRRAARDRTDHSPEAAGRISDRRISPRTRFPGCDRSAQRTEDPTSARRLDFFLDSLHELRRIRPRSAGARQGIGRAAAGPRQQKFGLENITILRADLGDPHRAVPCAHIAGTNGKGSTAAMLESILRAAGLAHRALHFAAP